MNSLRDRFRVLDERPVPDIWPEIEHRVVATSPMRTSATTTWRGRTGAGSINRVGALLLAGILAIVAAGLVVVGAGWLQRVQAPLTLAPTGSPAAQPRSSAPGELPRCAGGASEADARMTYLAGTPSNDRAWGYDRGEASFTGRIAGFSDGGRAVVLLDVAAGEMCRLVELTNELWVQGSPETTLAWSPTGAALAIGGPSPTTGRLLIWSPGRLRTVWIGNEGPVAAWSPDGGSIAAMPAGVRWGGLIFADGSADQRLDGAPNRMVWSPDGLSLAMQPMSAGSIPLGEFPFGSVSIWSADKGLVQVDDGDLEPILVGWQDDATLIVVDGGRLVSMRAADPSHVRVIAPIASELRLRFVQGTAHVSPDLRYAAYVIGGDDESGELRIADLREGTVVSVPARARGQLMTWSPDGTALAFDDDQNRLWVVNADGSGARQLTAAPLFVVDGAWQP
jgi:hypothetical protein